MYSVHIFIWIIISNYIQLATKIRYILFICPILGHFWTNLAVLYKIQWHSMFREDYYTTKKVLPNSTNQSMKTPQILRFLCPRELHTIAIIVLNGDRFNTKIVIYDFWIFLLIFTKFQDWFESTILSFWYTLCAPS